MLQHRALKVKDEQVGEEGGEKIMFFSTPAENLGFFSEQEGNTQ